MTKQITQTLNLENHTVHIWRLFLPDFFQELANLTDLLREDEQRRAERFQFPIHQQRFTITRGLLRKTLYVYTGIAPKSIIFHYSEHGKPTLKDNPLNLRFNVSHSHDMAVFAFTIGKEIGVDIEKIEPSFKDSVAKRFFSPHEYDELIHLPENERVNAFYKIWSRKEALIKALGKGLFTPLDSFSVSPFKERQIITLHSNEYLVQHLDLHHDYQSALAITQPLNMLETWQWSEHYPIKVN